MRMTLGLHFQNKGCISFIDYSNDPVKFSGLLSVPQGAIVWAYSAAWLVQVSHIHWKLS